MSSAEPVVPQEHELMRVWERVTVTDTCFANYSLDNSLVTVDVCGRDGTINTVMPANAGATLYRIAVDIKQAEIIPVQSLQRGVLEVTLTRVGFRLLQRERNGASGDLGWLYRRPLANYGIFELMYDGSMFSGWDPIRMQYKKTLEHRCATDIPLIAALCG